MKKILFLIVTFIFLFNPIKINAISNQPPKNFVLDEAEILKQSTKDYITVYSKYLKDNFKINYYLITISSLEEQDIKNYTDYIYDSYNLNQNSLLILVAKEERILRVKVGENLSEVITNSKIDDYLSKYFSPYLKNDEWDKGLKNGYSAFLKLICDSYNINTNEIVVKDVNNFLYEYKYYIISIILWIATILCYVLCAYFKFNLNSRKKKVTIKDTLVFSLCIFLNVIIILIAYLIDTLSFLLVVVYELFLVCSNYNLLTNKAPKKTKRKCQ